MASLDITADILKTHGKELMEEWRQNLNYFYDRCSEIKNLSILKNNVNDNSLLYIRQQTVDDKKNRKSLKINEQINDEDIKTTDLSLNNDKQFTKKTNKYFLDETKINFSFQAIGLSGLQLEEMLIKDYNIFTELVAGDLVMAMSGIGNTRQHFEALANALEDISLKFSSLWSKCNEDCLEKKPLKLHSQPLVLKEIPKIKHKVKLEDSVGAICATSLIPYPPGIPIACPGEVLTKELVTYVAALRHAGEKVMGVTTEGQVFVGKEE